MSLLFSLSLHDQICLLIYLSDALNEHLLLSSSLPLYSVLQQLAVALLTVSTVLELVVIWVVSSGVLCLSTGRDHLVFLGHVPCSLLELLGQERSIQSLRTGHQVEALNIVVKHLFLL